MNTTEKKYCKCGCGTEVNKTWVLGHQCRGARNPAKRPDVAKKISAAKMGHFVSEETRKKIAVTSKNISDETRQKIGAAQRGRPRSEATKRKISIAHTGKKKPIEAIQKRSETRKNFRFTDEAKKKIALSHTGQHHTEATRLKMSHSRKGDKSTLWRGGISFAPYTIEFNGTLKREIGIRDRHKCQHPECGRNNVKLHTHHINYIKTDSRPENLILLCGKHHSQTTAGDREFWQLFYEELMDMKTRDLSYRIPIRATL